MPVTGGREGVGLRLICQRQGPGWWSTAVSSGRVLRCDEGADIAEALLASPEYVSVNSEVRLNTPPPLGPELAVESGAGPFERLVAFLGRDPTQARG